MSALQPREMTSVFQYGHSPFKLLDENTITSPSSSFYYSHHSPYSLSPLSSYSQKLLRSPRKPMRKIPKVPFKVLDAPELQDDFYLNLVDWSSTNVLGVGLGTSVYLWSACTSQVTKLCDLANREDSVSSVSWSEKGNYIAVGTFKGDVQIWDAAASKLLSTLNGHTARVGALAWNHDLLCSGSRDRNVFLRDIRAPSNEGERKLTGHKQEVCFLNLILYLVNNYLSQLIFWTNFH
jgi:cell division cycle 20-like protein 1 (cofactor of APC complex)